VIITIDGPAGAGKSTVSREVAKRLGFLYLDTGAMYRACALFMLQKGIPLDNEELISSHLKDLNIKFKNGRIFLNGEDVSDKIRTPEIDLAASDISRIPSVRKKLTSIQRSIGENSDLVAEGRDMGTVVFPNADLKLFLTASPEERAKRRKKELYKKGDIISLDIILHQIKKRDKADTERAIAPLKPAEDSITLDSSNLSAEEVVKEIIKFANSIDRRKR